MTRPLVTVLVALAASTAAAGDGSWTWTFGYVSNDWRTEGTRGHTADCRTPGCDADDWRRGNLDASIGFRLGAERPLYQRGRFSLLAGVDATVLFTEYNLSQRELTILAAAGVGAARYRLGPVAGLLRVGGGLTVTDDGRLAEALLAEAGVEVGIGDARLRLTGRAARYGHPETHDVALLLVVPPLGPAPGHRWIAVAGTGSAWPGAIGGDDLRLKRAPAVELGLRRRIGDAGTRLGAGLEVTAWESEVRTIWISTPGNERSNNVTALSLLVERELGDGRVRWLVSAAAKLGDFAEPVGTFLHDENGDTVIGSSTELGAAVGAAARIPTRARPVVVVGLEQEYWFGLDLAALRLRLAVEVPL